MFSSRALHVRMFQVTLIFLVIKLAAMLRKVRQKKHLDTLAKIRASRTTDTSNFVGLMLKITSL